MASNAATKSQEVAGTDLNTDAIFNGPTPIATNAQTTASTTQTVKGKGQDGPIVGGTVFFDASGNGTQDSDEPSGTTDAAGNFSLVQLGVSIQTIFVVE